MKAIIGDLAPDFSLTGSDGVQHVLHDGSNRVTIVLFYVGDNLPTCSRQLYEYNDAHAALQDAGVRLLGIAPQAEESHYAFTCRLDLTFPLLVDADLAVGNTYGVTTLLNIYRRSAFVVDHEGILRYAHRAGVRGYLRHKPAQDVIRVATDLLPAAP